MWLGSDGTEEHGPGGGPPVGRLVGPRTIPPAEPANPFYYERLGPLIDEARGRYVALTAHNLPFSRLHKLRGFANTMQDFYVEPERVRRVLDMIVKFKVEQCRELHRRFGDRIDGLFVADDWGTQQGTFVSLKTFDEFFAPAIGGFSTPSTAAAGTSFCTVAGGSTPSCPG